ncbi:MAG: hypothetical protein CME38_06465 [Haliea sp.]|nr:hypothetical protein [Haliea sp.]
MNQISQNDINGAGNVAKPSPRVSVDSAARLAGVAEAEKQMRKGKIPESDRVVLAKNLGKMFNAACRRHKELSTRQIFLAAFGEVDGESQYKKRKTLVWMPGEEGRAPSLQTRAIKYLDLCDHLMRYLEFPQGLDDAGKRKRALLRLIEGSSYDQHGVRRERIDAEYRQELDNRIGTVVRRLREAVDIDWMRLFVNDHPLYSRGLTGEFVPRNHAEGLQIMEATMEVGGGIQNCLAPTARIASVFTRPKVDRYMYVEIPFSGDEEDSGNLPEELAKFFGAESAEIEDLVPKVLEQEGWQECSNDAPPSNLWFRSVVDMEVRYDLDSASWKPLLLWRRLLQAGLNPVDEKGRALDFFSQPCRGAEGRFLGFDEDSYLYAVLEARSSGACRWLLFVMDDFYMDYIEYTVELFNASLDTGFCPPSAGYETIMFQRLDDCCNNDVSYELEDSFESWRADTDTGFVKAPPGSLARAIIGNLAYAGPDQRLDTLLIKDAKHKYGILKDYADKGEREYREAISRFQASDARPE